MWQGNNNITGFKGNKPATVNIAASLPDELNHFYARFEADNTAHTESAPAAAAEEVNPLSLSVADVTRSFKRVNIRKAVGPDGIPGRVLRACAFQLAGVLRTFSICPSLCLWFPHASKNPQLCPYQRKIKSHAWVTGGPLLWPPSSASETTSDLCYLLHWTHYNLNIAPSVPQTMLLPSPCTLLSPTWKIRTPMWECCSWIIVQHLTPCLPHWLRSSRLWDWTDLCAAGSWTSWQAEVRWSEWATTHHLLWSSTLVLRRAASSAHSCNLCTHTTVQPHTALTSLSHLPMTQRW